MSLDAGISMFIARRLYSSIYLTREGRTSPRLQRTKKPRLKVFLGGRPTGDTKSNPWRLTLSNPDRKRKYPAFKQDEVKKAIDKINNALVE